MSNSTLPYDERLTISVEQIGHFIGEPSRPSRHTLTRGSAGHPALCDLACRHRQSVELVGAVRRVGVEVLAAGAGKDGGPERTGNCCGAAGLRLGRPISA